MNQASEQLWVPPSAKLDTYKKADPPPTGPAFGPWAGERDLSYATLPGGGVLAFDLSKLTLEDYRQMRHHYQVNASLAILTFMLHQLDWHIECEDQKIADECERQLRLVWTRLIRGLSQSFWAGYSPMVIEYDNNVQERSIEITKFKDLIPERCEVNWREVDGYIPPEHRSSASVAPKLKVYDGIKVRGQRWPVPVENSLWYPVLMENGDYYGRKLLKPAFQSWFFSILIHLFANRYFERFGEPLPIGRADFEADVEIEGEGTVTGRRAMEHILERLRSRSVVVLPSQRHPETDQYDFDLEYLESQMRGADFERYLMRLDEEITLALFTPLLLMRTADVGSYNLGDTHIQMFLWMLNALAGDIKEYIDRYVLERIKAYNFTPNAPRVQWVPRKMGNQDKDTIKAVMTEMVRKDHTKPDLNELGQAVGLSLKEVRAVTSDDDDDTTPEPDPRTGGGRPERDETSGTRRRGHGLGLGQPRATAKQVAERMGPQVANAFERGTFGTADFTPSLGYQRRMEQAWMAEGASREEAERRTERFYEGVRRWLKDAQSIGADEYDGPDDFMSMFERVLDTQLEKV